MMLKGFSYSYSLLYGWALLLSPFHVTAFVYTSNLSCLSLSFIIWVLGFFPLLL